MGELGSLGGSMIDNYKQIEGRDNKSTNQSALLNKVMQKGGIRASFDAEHFKAQSPQESDFLPSLGQNIGENKTSHGRNHKECETLPIKPQNKFKKNELAAGSVLDDEFDLDDF